MRRACLFLAAIVLLAGVSGQTNAAPQATTIRPVGAATIRLTSADRGQISRLASGRGQPWIAIARWPTPEGRDSWQWTVHVYLTPGSDTGTLRRGRVVVITAKLPAPNAFTSRKEWHLEPDELTYAEVPMPGRSSLALSSDRDPHRPFITNPSRTYGPIKDADVLAAVAAVRSSSHGGNAIAELSLIEPNLITAETIDANPALYRGESIIVHRDDDRWTVVQAVERQWASPAEVSFLSHPRTGKPAGTGSVVVAVTVVAGANLFGLWLLFSGWRAGRGSPQFVLGMLPLNLLFLVAPVPVIIRQIIESFQNFAPQGGNIAATLAVSERAFFIGSAGFLVAITVAAALQWHAGWTEPAPDETGTEGARTAGWQSVALQCSPVIAPLTVLLCAIVAGLPRTIVERTTAGIQAAATSGGADLQQLSIKISSWLILSFIGGMVGTVALVLLGVITLILVRSHRFASRVTTYSWVVLAIVAGLGLWNLARVLSDVSWLASNP